MVLEAITMLKRIAQFERRLMLATLRIFMARMEKMGPIAVDDWYDCQAPTSRSKPPLMPEQ